jgi:probable HAF family extracellular repeat protein
MNVRWRWAAAGLAAALTMTAPAVATAAPADRSPGRLIELADLGGGRRSYAGDVNDRGDIVGTSLRRNTGRVAAALWPRGQTRPIALRVRDGSPEAINNHGVVAGGAAGGRLFVWRHGRTRYFPYPGRDDGLWVNDINERGQVVGSTFNSATFSGRAFVWSRGVITKLPTPPNSSSGTTAINDRGQILGWVLNHTTQVDRAVIWSPRGSAKRPYWTRTDLGTLGGRNSYPTDINEKGQVIGSSDVPGSGLPHPFLWQHGRMTDLLGTYPALNASAHAINDAGLVAGHIQVSDDRFHAVVWRHGRLIDISTPGYNSEALAVNNRGQVAGLTYRADTNQGVRKHAFRWQSGRMKLFTPAQPAANLEIVDIDARGRIVASIITNDEALLLRSVG